MLQFLQVFLLSKDCFIVSISFSLSGGPKTHSAWILVKYDLLISYSPKREKLGTSAESTLQTSKVCVKFISLGDSSILAIYSACDNTKSKPLSCMLIPALTIRSRVFTRGTLVYTEAHSAYLCSGKITFFALFFLISVYEYVSLIPLMQKVAK